MSPISVLLVDDEEDLSLVLAERLQMRNLDARGVLSAEEALKLIDENDFDVIVIDVKMPGIGGLELMRKIKLKNAEQKIILFTGHGSQKEFEAAMNEGAHDYLLKPIKIDKLVEKIKKITAE